MALNNLTNFLNLIDTRRLKTTPEPTDVIPLGTPDRKFDGGYKPTFIQYEDLANSILSQLPPSTDANDQKLVIGGEGDELRLRDGTLNGTPVPDSIIPISNIAAGMSFEDMGDTPEYSGNSLKALRINAAETGVEAYTIPLPEDTNTMNYPGVAFVGPFGDGNNATAVVGDGNKPYFTIETAAQNANIVIIKPGNYSQIVDFQDGVTYYFMPGARFTGGYFRDLSSTGKTCKVLGYLEASVNSSTEFIQINSDINLYFEFTRIYSRRGAAIFQGSPTVTLKGDYIRGDGLITASSISVRGQANVKIDLTEGMEGNHYQLFFRAGAGGVFSGSFEINAKYIRTLPTSFYGNSYKSTVLFDRSEGGTVKINADIENTHTAQGAGDGRGALTFNNSFAPAVDVTVRGNIHGNNNEAVRTAYRASVGNLKVYNAEITTNNTRAVIQLAMTAITTGNFPVYFQGCRFEGLACVVWAGRKMTFKDCTFHNIADQGTFPDNPSFNIVSSNLTVNSTMELYLHDCILFAPVTVANETFGNAPVANFTLGCTNVRSNNPLGVTAVDTYGGFTQIPTLKVPQI
jgi:hypothetical protein